MNDTLEDRQSKDSASETNMEPGILKIEVRFIWQGEFLFIERNFLF